MVRVNKNFVLTILAATVSICWPAIAFAAEDSHTASVGTLVAAALETAGYIQLSIIMRDLMSMFSSTAALVYVGVAITGLTFVAYSGSYQQALWFLIGPPLYYAMMSTSTQAAGAEWQFGTYLPERANLAAEYIGQPQVEAKVPLAFHEFNVWVSTIIQNLVAVITDEKHRTELKFQTRQQMLDGFLKMSMGSPQLEMLTRNSFYMCGDMMHDAQMIASGTVDPELSGNPSFRNAQSRYQAKMLERTHSIQQGTPLYSYLQDLTGKLPDCLTFDADQKMYTSCSTPETGDPAETYRPFFQCLACHAYDGGTCDPTTGLATGGQLTKRQTFVDEPMSCADLWCMVGVGVGDVTDTYRKSLEGQLPAFDPQQAQGSELTQDIYREIKSKLVQDGSFTTVYDPNKELAKNIWAIQHVVGGYLVRKTMITDPRSKSVLRMAEHWELDPTANSDHRAVMSDQEIQARSRKLNNAQLGEAERWSLYTFAMLLPYIQGVILYILAAAFPFTMLLLLIPGKASGVWTWFAAWAWAKSWDVGFAAIMVIDEVLWELLPHTPLGEPPTTFDPTGVLSTTFNGDPAYSLSNYYLIVGMLMVTVPILSAQVILRGKAAMAGVLIEGIKSFGDRLGNVAAINTSMHQMHDVTNALTQLGAQQATADFGNPASFQAPGAKEAWAKVEEVEQAANAWNAAASGMTMQMAAVGAASVAGATIGSKFFNNMSDAAKKDQSGITSRLLNVARDGGGLISGFNRAQGVSLGLLREAQKLKTSIAYADMAWKLHEYGQSPEYMAQRQMLVAATNRRIWWLSQPQKETSMVADVAMPERAELRGERIGADATTSIALGAFDAVFEQAKTNDATNTAASRPGP